MNVLKYNLFIKINFIFIFEIFDFFRVIVDVGIWFLLFGGGEYLMYFRFGFVLFVIVYYVFFMMNVLESRFCYDFVVN